MHIHTLNKWYFMQFCVSFWMLWLMHIDTGRWSSSVTLNFWPWTWDNSILMKLLFVNTIYFLYHDLYYACPECWKVKWTISWVSVLRRDCLQPLWHDCQGRHLKTIMRLINTSYLFHNITSLVILSYLKQSSGPHNSWTFKMVFKYGF